jgi:predicted HicB family RNase H-like nuclease
MSALAPRVQRSLDDYLTLNYSLRVIADPDGGYVLDFPDLPGCMSQVEDLDEVSSVAQEIKHLWLESAHRLGLDIPLPTYPEEYSGKFNVRLPRSLHRRLAEAADRDGVSLNQYVVMLLSEGVASTRGAAPITSAAANQQQREKATA